MKDRIQPQRARLPRAAPVFAVCAVAQACSYNTTYVPPDDSRARVVWRGRGLQVIPGAPSPRCAAATTESDAAPARGVRRERVVIAGPNGVHVPVWILVGPYRVRHTGAAGAVAPAVSGRGSARAGGGGLGSGGGGGGGAVVLAVVLAVAAAASSAVAIGLSVSDPEDDEIVAAAIDEVNASNDVRRRMLRACASSSLEAP